MLDHRTRSAARAVWCLFRFLGSVSAERPLRPGGWTTRVRSDENRRFAALGPHGRELEASEGDGTRSHRHHRRPPAQPQERHRRDPEEEAGDPHAASRARASRRSPSTRSTPRASAATSRASTPTPGSSWARWTSRSTTRSAAWRPRSRSSRRRPAATRARRSARSPRSTTTCACCGRASGRLTCHNCGRAGLAAVVAADRARDRRRSPAGTKFLLAGAAREGAQGRAPRRARAGAQGRASRACAWTGSCCRLEDDDPPRQEEEALDRRGGGPADRQAGHRASASTTRWRPRCATARGMVIVAPEGQPEKVMSQHRACHHCGISFPEPSPQLFSFNSPQGMCPECSGLGTRMEMDPSWWCRTRTSPSTRARSSRWARSARAPAGAPTSCARWRASAASTSTSRGVAAAAAPQGASSTAPATSGCRSRCRARGARARSRCATRARINSMMRAHARDALRGHARSTTRSSSPTGPARPAAGGACGPKALGVQDRRTATSPRSPRSAWQTRTRFFDEPGPQGRARPRSRPSC